MLEKGYVVCLLKYMIGTGVGAPQFLDTQSGNAKSVCLGYFGRADVMAISEFKDYMRVASEADAEFMGSRKQLLLYPFGEALSDKIKLAQPQSGLPETDQERNALPFQPAEDDFHPSFCCLSIFNIKESIKRQVGQNSIRKVAECMSEQIQAYMEELDGRPFPYAIMGLLGTEDLCVITLSNYFEDICGAVNRLRGLVDQPSETPVVENSHSIFMIDFSQQAQAPQWGDAAAEIHFSLKAASGISYLEKVKACIEENSGDSSVVLESRVGEYDAVIRCPANSLGPYLYGKDGYLNYLNANYRNAAYQSETVLYQKASFLPFSQTMVSLTEETVVEGHPEETVPIDGESMFSGMKKMVSAAIKEINRNILGVEDDPQDDIAYIKSGMYRLLKDFMRIAAIPFGGTFQIDLHMQFEVAINAITCAAKKYNAKMKLNCGSAAKRDFDITFSLIVAALSKSMQAASQIDRLNFEEQQSHLQNTGAYHKVLLAYYGIVKDILALLYTIPRNEDSKQAQLIPLLSFGHTPILFSDSFDAFYDGRPAKLICITLPYQALTNIPKYIGMLIHELFHYSAPADREHRNEAAGKCLVAVALRQFLSSIACSMAECSDQTGHNVFLSQRTEFLAVVNDIFDIIKENQLAHLQASEFELEGTEGSTNALASNAFFTTLRAGILPDVASVGDHAEELYCNAWIDLRKSLLGKSSVNADIAALFALTKEFTASEEQEYIKTLYRTELFRIRQSIQSYLNPYEVALREVPPDLFDIFFSTQEKSVDLKAKQYLWQIHSIRCDKLYYSEKSNHDVAGNTMRMGVILDYFVFGLYDRKQFTSFEARENQINIKLQEWFSNVSVDERDKQAQAKKIVYDSVKDDYLAYHSESLFSNVMFKEYIQPIAQQIEAISDDDAACTVMDRLSGFYESYYTALDEEGEETLSNVLFDLSIRIIEHYQQQPTLKALTENSKNSRTMVPRATAEDTALTERKDSLNWMCESKALHPRDLSKQIVNAYNIMVPKGAVTPLWFRGQRLESRNLLPGVMRNKKTFTEYGFQSGMRKMMTLAKAKILPQGEGFHKAEWLAFLQHNGFDTNLLDWSEDLHSALFFAIERWIENPDTRPEGNASISVFNPVLYNLVQRMLLCRRRKDRGKEAKAEYEKAVQRICNYLREGVDRNGSYAIPLFTTSEKVNEYEGYFDLDVDNEIDENDICHSIAAITPMNSERMKMQAGVFTFFDLRAKPKNVDGTWSYEYCDPANVQQEYFNVLAEATSELGVDCPTPIPFLHKIILDCSNAKDFVQYVRAIGIRKYRMYPEIDKLAEDIKVQAF